VFTNATDDFVQDGSYTKFGTFTVLNHRGDFEAATIDLSQKHFGKVKVWAWENDDWTTKVIPNPIPKGGMFRLFKEGVAPPPPFVTRDIDADLAKTHRTDLGNAERFVARHGPDVRYCHPWRSWLVWDGRRWKIDDTGEARRRACQTAREILHEASLIEDEDDRKKHSGWAFKSESSERLAAMLRVAECEKGVPILPNELNRDPWLFNCSNGTIDLRTGELRQHSRRDFITQLCPVEFDPGAQCPLWQATLSKFFHRSDPSKKSELIGYWQRICGYAMVGEVRDHVLPVAFGPGSNGKSTILGTLLDVFGPDYGMKATPDMFMARKHDPHPTERTDLFGKRLVAAIETEAGRRLNETMVKELTGGDRIRARRMRENNWEFSPTHTLIMATNHKPVIHGTDNGIWRRLKLVPFTVSVSGADADTEMLEKLRAEHPGILAWCVCGTMAWKQYGLKAPEEVTEATASYRKEQDVIGAFLDEFTLSSSSCRVKAGVLYARYKTWAESGNEYVATQTAFGLAIQERGFEKHTSNGIWYLGIGLRQEEKHDPWGMPR
jgi:putative DNA primase/helicase